MLRKISAAPGALALLSVCSFAAPLTATELDLDYNDLNFGGSGVIIQELVGNGTSVDDLVLYKNVVTIDGQQVDALVRTEALVGTMTDFDNASVSGGNQTRFFSPRFSFSGSDSSPGYGVFQIDFIEGGSYDAGTQSGAPVVLQHVRMHSYDLDAYPSGSSGSQFQEFGGFTSMTLGQNTKVSYALNETTGLTRFTNNDGNSEDDSTHDNYRVQVDYDAISSFRIAMGSKGTTSYFFLDFGVGAIWDGNTVKSSGPELDLDLGSAGIDHLEEYQGTPLALTADGSSGANLISNENAFTKLELQFVGSDIANGSQERLQLGTLDAPLDFADGYGANLTFSGVNYRVSGTVASGEHRLTLARNDGNVMSKAAAEALLDALQYHHQGGAPTEGERRFGVTVFTPVFSTPTAQFLVDVGAFAIAPTANSDTVNGSEDASAVSLSLSGSDVDGTVAAFELTALPPNGTLYLDAALSQPVAAGTRYAASGQALPLYFVPSAHWYGQTTFTYHAIDDGGLNSLNEGVITLNIAAVNDLPVPQPLSLSGSEDQPWIEVPLSATDEDGTVASFSLADLPAGGLLYRDAGLTQDVSANVPMAASGNALTLYFVPGPNWNGTANFDYVARDNTGADSAGTARVQIQVAAVNDPPVAVDDAITVNEDQVYTSQVDLDANDSDPENQPLSVVAGTMITAQGGSLSLKVDGSYRYTPKANFHGQDHLDYQISDGTLTDTGRLTITVLPVADLVAGDEAFVTDEDVTLNGSLGASTSSGGSLSFAKASEPANGSLTVNADGTFTYIPDANYHGPDSFTYTVTDAASGESVTATVTLTVNPLDDLVAGDEAFVTDEDVTLNGSLGASTSSGGSLSFAKASEPANGSLTVNADGTFTYIPDANYHGPDSFTYTVTDAASGESVTATVTLTVNPLDDLVAGDEAFVTDEDVTLNGSLGASTSSGGSLSFAKASEPANGSLTVNADGTFTYIPDANYHGPDSFTVTVTDPVTGESITVTLTLTVRPVNDAPVAVDDAGSLDEDSSLILDLVANDQDDSGLNRASVRVTQSPSHGEFSLANGSLTYTPDPDFNGPDTLRYRVQDHDERESNEATVTLTVRPVNDAPVANNDLAELDEDGEIHIDVLANDTDVDANLAADPIELLTPPEEGAVSLASGQVLYRPAADFAGADEFTYRIRDEQGLWSAPATVFVTVVGINDAPVAEDDVATTDEDTPVFLEPLQNDSDVDGPLDVADISWLSGPAHGTLERETGEQRFRYLPGENFHGTDTLNYLVKDADGLPSNQAQITITINSVNDAPVAHDDNVELAEDGEFAINVLGNDEDVDGTLQPATLEITQDPANGSLSRDPATGLVTYRALPNLNGDDSFRYRVQDDQGAWSNEALVRLSVLPVNDAPLANDDTGELAEDTSLTLLVLANDQDIDGSLVPASATLDTPPRNGQVTIAADGSMTYTPDPDFHGQDSFRYQVEDDQGAESNPAEVRLTVTPLNDAPQGQPDAYQLDEGALLSPTALLVDNDRDVDGDTLSVRLGTGVSHGSLTLDSDGRFQYQHDGSENHADAFDYFLSDGQLETGPVQVNLTILPVNDAPVAMDDSATTAEDQPIRVDLLANDQDPDGDRLSLSLVTTPKLGTASLSADGSLLYQPLPDLNGSDRFEYQVNDGHGGLDTAEVRVEITPVNDGPVARDDTAETPEDTQVQIPVLANDSDVEGHALTVTLLSAPEHGLASVGDRGVIAYLPDPDFHGDDQLHYAIDDGNGGSAQAEVRIRVTEVNDPPVARDDRALTDRQTPVQIPVLDNDSDVDGDALAIVSASVDHGEITLVEGQGLRYQAGAEPVGIATARYQISDGRGGVASARVSIVIEDSNGAPVAVDDEVVLAAGQTQVTVEVLANDSDPDGDTLTVIGAQSEQGNIERLGNQIRFTVDDRFTGQATIQYRVSDGRGGEDQALVRIFSQEALLPVITLPETVWVDADALFTKVDLGLAQAEDRFGNPLPVSLLDGLPFYPPGDNTALWQACDDEGRCATAPQKVYVRPLVSIAKDQVIREGQPVAVEVVLNGSHFDYPVVVPFSVSGDADGNDHTLVDGEVVFQAGSSAWITFDTLDDGVAEGAESLVITLEGDINPGNRGRHTVTLVETNLAPEIRLQVFQDGEPRLQVYQDGGDVSLLAGLSDPNPKDRLALSWQSGALADLDADELRLRFDPASVTPGIYPVGAQVQDPYGLSDDTQVFIEVLAAKGSLGAGIDTDGDLVPDDQDGHHDLDGDGIADFLDPMTGECNVLPETLDTWNGYIVEGDPAVCLKRGQYSLVGLSGGAQLLAADFDAADDDLVPDPDAVNIGGLFDFTAYTLPKAGQSLQVVVPQRQAIPEGAVYRRFLAQDGWDEILVGDGYALASAPGEAGYCPPPGGDAWTPGLNLGHWCVQITLVDGGVHDADGQVNGEVAHSGGVGVPVGVNRLPLAEPDSLVLRAGEVALLDVLANDSDPDGDNLSLVALSDVFGELRLLPEQTLEYRAPEDFLGLDLGHYSISDGQGGTAQAAIRIQVIANTGPVALDDAALTDANQAVEIRVLNNDSDHDGDALRVVAATVDTGSVERLGGGMLRYTPATDYVGPAVIDYRIDDGHGGTAEARVHVTVQGNQVIKTEGGGSGVLNWGGLLALLGGLLVRRTGLLVGLLTILALLTTPSRADDREYHPWFLTGQFNWATSDVSKSDLDGDFADNGVDARVLSLDEERWGYGLGIGYHFTPRWFVEAGYLDIEEVELTLQGVFNDRDAFYDAIEHVYPESGEGPYLQLGYRYPLGDNWSLTGKAGAFFWEGDYVSFPVSGPEGQGSDHPDGTDPYYGLSLDYRLADHWHLSAQVERVEFDNYPTTLLGLSLRYQFGHSQPKASKPVAVDTDRDGVLDPQDLCPGTPLSHAVDGQGCTQWVMVSREFVTSIYFANDSDRIPDAEIEKLVALARFVRDHEIRRIELQGFASSPASEGYNLRLSQRRAERVAQSLLQSFGIEAELVPAGQGELSERDNSEAAQAKNRRVDVSLQAEVREPAPRATAVP